MSESPRPPEPPDAPEPAEVLRRGGRWWSLAALVSLAILAALTWPWRFGFDPGSTWLGMAGRPVSAVVLQASLFVPFGICEARLVRRILNWWSLAVLAIFVDVTLLGLLGETLQYWLPARTSSLVDLVAAAAGGVAGALIADALAGRPAKGGGEA